MIKLARDRVILDPKIEKVKLQITTTKVIRSGKLMNLSHGQIAPGFVLHSSNYSDLKPALVIGNPGHIPAGGTLDACHVWKTQGCR